MPIIFDRAQMIDDYLDKLEDDVDAQEAIEFYIDNQRLNCELDTDDELIKSIQFHYPSMNKSKYEYEYEEPSDDN